LLVFPEEDSLELVRKLLAEETEITVFTELEQDALIEVGNVILTSCISAFADTLGVEIEYSDLPVIVRGSKGEDLLSSANGDQDYNLFMEVDFKLDQDNISGIVLIALSLKSAVDLQTKLQEYLPTLEI
jgi:chemotaxis protein CheC